MSKYIKNYAYIKIKTANNLKQSKYLIMVAETQLA